jgi:hypothetical protein
MVVMGLKYYFKGIYMFANGYFFAPPKNKYADERDGTDGDSYMIEYADFQCMNAIDNSNIIKAAHDDWHIYYHLFSTYAALTPGIVESGSKYICPGTNNSTKSRTSIMLTLPPMGMAFDMYLNTYSRAQQVGELVHTFQYLLGSLDKLFAAGIIHNNMGFENITVINGAPVIANFDTSINLNKRGDLAYLGEFFTERCPDYAYWAPEVHLMSHIFVSNLTVISKADIIEAINSPDVGFLDKYVHMGADDAIADICTYASTWDSYALSIDFRDWARALAPTKAGRTLCDYFSRFCSFNPADRVRP